MNGDRLCSTLLIYISDIWVVKYRCSGTWVYQPLPRSVCQTMITVVLIYIVGGIIQNLVQSGSASGAAPLPGLWADYDCEAG